MAETAVQTTRSVKKEGVEVLQTPELRFPYIHDEDHDEASCDPAAHGGPHARAGGRVLKDVVTLWRAHSGEAHS